MAHLIAALICLGMENVILPKTHQGERLFTHLDELTLVRLKKLLRTERRLAKIWANGVTIRSSPWLQLTIIRGKFTIGAQFDTESVVWV